MFRASATGSIHRSPWFMRFDGSFAWFICLDRFCGCCIGTCSCICAIFSTAYGMEGTMDMTSNTSNSSASASAPHNHQQVPFDDQLLAYPPFSTCYFTSIYSSLFGRPYRIVDYLLLADLVWEKNTVPDWKFTIVYEQADPEFFLSRFLKSVGVQTGLTTVVP